MTQIKILIVTDDKLLVSVLKRDLSSIGFKNITFVNNTNNSLDQIEDKQPDLILIDTLIEKNSEASNSDLLVKAKIDTPVICFISESGDVDFLYEQTNKTFSFLIKPFNERELQLTIDFTLTKYRQEKKLKLSQDKFRNIYENAHVGIYRSSPDGRLLEANPALIKMLGYSSFEELASRNLESNQFYTDDTRERFKKQMEESGEVINFETRILKKDGSLLIVLENSKLFHDSETDEIYYEGMVHDITQKKIREAEVDSTAKFPSENPYPVMRISRDGKLEYANDASEHILNGWGCNIGESVPDEIGKKIVHVFETKKFEEFELLGNNQIYILTIVPVLAGEYANIYGRDITEMKNLQMQLQQAQKMEAIGQLAGGISHDFNNILTAINGYAEMCLIKIDPNDATHEYIMSILKAGRRASKLTSKLLAFSRKQIIELKPLDINTLIIDLSDMLIRLIGEDISVEKNLSQDIGSIKADPNQIEQVLTNLVVNARDAINQKNDSTSSQKISIETSQVYLDEKYAATHAGGKAGMYLLLSVSDTGIGMDKTIQDKIFEPFFTTKNVGEGTGLGMATVYGIVKQNRGFIYVYSEPNKGTTFKIYWPSASEGFGKTQKKVFSKEVEKGQENILIVEDDENIRSFITSALESLGYQVITAINGHDALDKIDQTEETIDLAITDVIMPAMGGKELADQLKIVAPDLKVLFTSGYTGNHIVHSGVLEEGVNFIQKPYSIKDFAKKVRQILDEQ